MEVTRSLFHGLTKLNLYHVTENTVSNTMKATYVHTSFRMALKWLKIIYDLGNVSKTLSKHLLIIMHDTEYIE